MQKNLFGIFFLFVFACNLGAHLFPFINYAVNKTFIAKNLCVNKNKPKLHCNGKCHLKKQLAAAAGSEPGKQESKEKYEDYFFSEMVYTLSIEAPIPQPATAFSNNYRFCHLLTVFHPPCV